MSRFAIMPIVKVPWLKKTNKALIFKVVDKINKEIGRGDLVKIGPIREDGCSVATVMHKIGTEYRVEYVLVSYPNENYVRFRNYARKITLDSNR